MLKYRPLTSPLVIALVSLAGCSGGGGSSPSPDVLVPSAPPTAVPTATAIAGPVLYSGAGPATSPPSGAPAASSTTLVLRDAPAAQEGPLSSGPGAQYLVDEPGYTGSLSTVSSCSPAANVDASFENGPIPGGNGYSFSPGPSGTGPAALLDVASSGVFGPQTCVLSIVDDHGRSATVTVTNQRLLLYPQDSGRSPRIGATGSAYQLLANFSPTTFLVYEQGYSGRYTLAPVTCKGFAATLTPGPDPASGAILELDATLPPGRYGCAFTVTDDDGQTVVANAYYEGV